MSVINITGAEDFAEKVLKAEKPVLVDFWAPWCGPCKMVGPEVEAVGAAYEGRAIIVKVNVDDQASLASQFNVMSVPTLLIMKDGQEVNRIVGYRPRKDISAALDAVI